MNIAEANDADIVATPFYLWYEDGHREKSKRLDFDVITGAGYLNMLFCDKAHWPLWANFMRMELVRMADVDFNFRLGIGEDMVTNAAMQNTGSGFQTISRLILKQDSARRGLHLNSAD